MWTEGRTLGLAEEELGQGQMLQAGVREGLNPQDFKTCSRYFKKFVRCIMGKKNWGIICYAGLSRLFIHLFIQQSV